MDHAAAPHLSEAARTTAPHGGHAVGRAEGHAHRRPAARGETSIRVRYAETDRMGLLHHANYLVYLEQARTELLRDAGLTYRDLEDQGFLLVLTKVDVRYKRPAYYDDLLTVRTTVARTTSVRIDHTYEVLRGHELLAEASTTLACVDRDGRPQALPEILRAERRTRS